MTMTTTTIMTMKIVLIIDKKRKLMMILHVHHLLVNRSILKIIRIQIMKKKYMIKINVLIVVVLLYGKINIWFVKNVIDS